MTPETINAAWILLGISLITIGAFFAWGGYELWCESRARKAEQIIKSAADLACEGLKGNRCVGEGCYGEACRTLTPFALSPAQRDALDQHWRGVVDARLDKPERVAAVVSLPALASVTPLPMQRTGVER